MHDRGLEITGFACRWCLLALAGATILVGSWTGLRGAGPVAGGLRAAAMPADLLCRQSPQRAAYLALHHVDSPLWRGARYVLVSLPDGTQLMDHRWRANLSVVSIPRARAGRIELKTTGLPYGPMAFRRGRAMVVIVPPNRREFLVDGRLALSVLGANTPTWRRCMELMAKRGQIAFLFVGSVEDYPAARAKLRHVHPDLPVEYVEPGDRGTYYRLGKIAAALNPSKIKAHPRPTVVTDRGDLAVLAGRRGFSTHLVGRPDRPIAGGKRIVQHASLLEFSEWLEAEAPRAEGGRR